jgi:hypothetical protein
MTLRLKNEIFADTNFGMGLAAIEQYKLPHGTVLYSVSKLIRRLSTQFKIYREKYFELKKKHGIVEMKDLPDAFMDDLMSLNNIEFELDCFPIDLADFSNIKLSPAEFSALRDVLKVGDDKAPNIHIAQSIPAHL